MPTAFIKADKFLPKQIRNYTKQDWERAFENLNIDFCTPIITLLNESHSFENLRNNISKVKFDIESPTELEKFILEDLKNLSSHMDI